MTDKLTTFTNRSRYRTWDEEECRLMINAALLKLIDDAGGHFLFPRLALVIRTEPKG